MIAAAIVTLVGVALIAVPAVLIPALLQIRGRVAFVVAAGVTGAAVVVGLSLVLSVPRALSRTGLLVGEACVAAMCAALWLRRGRPPPPSFRPASVLASIPRSGALLVAGVALAVQFYVALAVAPNNWDSMTYHLSRAAYWLQYGSAGEFPGGTVRQLDSAPNGELLQAWTMALTDTDRFASLVQWGALVGTALCVFAGARLLRFAPPAAAFAAGIFVILPQPIMQATTTQNDVIVTFFLTASALFTARGIRDQHVGDIAVGAAAAGLALGTKGTALFAAPALALIGVAALVAYRPGRRLVLTGAALYAGGLIALGSFSYVSNYVRTGDPFGGLTAHTTVPEGTPLARNAALVSWSLVDSPGVSMPFVDTLLMRGGRSLQTGLESPTFDWAVDTSLHEDAVGFGLVGWLVFLPLLVVCLLRRGASTAQRVLAAAALTYLGLFALFIGFNPWVCRLMIPMVALGAPLLAVVAGRSWLRGAALTLGLLSLIPSVLLNRSKVLLTPPGAPSVLAGDRIQQQTVNRTDVAPMLRWMTANVPATADIGYVGGEDEWDYPLFGAHRTRRVVRFGDIAAQTPATLRRHGIVGVLLVKVPPPPGLQGETIAPGYSWVQLDG
ncbi:MAG: glycosyltransferase family 39 protein [Solirubrobacteraceae bacterium]|nr:glycosyltransferase family 39 protein [Solirubrobacteraceae bacterium]